MAAAPAIEPMASEGSNFEIVIEKQPGNDFEIIPEVQEEDEIKPDHYYEDGGIPVFKPVSSVARSFCSAFLVPDSSRRGSVVPKEVGIAGREVEGRKATL